MTEHRLQDRHGVPVCSCGFVDRSPWKGYEPAYAVVKAHCAEEHDHPQQALIDYLNVSLKVAETGMGWDTSDPRSRAFYEGVKVTAKMALIMMEKYTPTQDVA